MQERILKIAAALSFGALLATGLWILKRPPRQELAVYWDAPEFTLTSQDGKPFDSSRLKGKVWVASFVYSSCKGSCPMLGAQMKRLYDSIPSGDDFALVSISVDPVRDTPQRLAQYAKDLGVHDARWVFLTGAKSTIKAIINKGFRLPAEPGVVVGDDEILHDMHLALVDSEGRIRNFYDGTLAESAVKIKQAAEQLIEEKKRS
jgi:protein SCO1/2